MSLGLFSIPASAEEIASYDSYLEAQLIDNGVQYGKTLQWRFPLAGSDRKYFDNSTFTATSVTRVYGKYHFYHEDGTTILKADRPVKINVNNVSQRIYVVTNTSTGSETAFYVKYLIEPAFQLLYTDGTNQYVPAEYKFNSGTNAINLTASFTPEKDVRKILLHTDANLKSHGMFSTIGAVQLEPYNANALGLDLVIESEETGWLKKIFNKVTDGFNSVVETITNLPQKIGEMISGLFVPSEESMTGIKDQWDELLSQRFGAVYEVSNVVLGSWDNVMNAQETATINFPSATISLPEGEEFTFGGYDVQIVPDRFQSILTIVKTAIGGVCTFAFINGLRKRYDEVMGVEQ